MLVDFDNKETIFFLKALHEKKCLFNFYNLKIDVVTAIKIYCILNNKNEEYIETLPAKEILKIKSDIISFCGNLKEKKKTVIEIFWRSHNGE